MKVLPISERLGTNYHHQERKYEWKVQYTWQDKNKTDKSEQKEMLRGI